MQQICSFLKIKISKKRGHVKKINSIYLQKKVIKRKCYHNYVVYKSDVGKNVKILGMAKDDTVELIKIKNKKIYGMMWHPDRHSYKDFKNDLKLINF